MRRCSKPEYLCSDRSEDTLERPALRHHLPLDRARDDGASWAPSQGCGRTMRKPKPCLFISVSYISPRLSPCRKTERTTRLAGAKVHSPLRNPLMRRGALADGRCRRRLPRDHGEPARQEKPRPLSVDPGSCRAWVPPLPLWWRRAILGHLA